MNATPTETPHKTAPSGELLQLLRKGAFDSLLQVAATTLVRLGLVVAVLVLAPFVTLEELGRFDMFVVGSNLVLIAVVVGMDSGLAIVADRSSAAVRRALLVVALTVLGGATVLWSVILALGLPFSGLNISDQRLAWLTLIYGTFNGALLLIFSWFRWQTRATIASLILITAHGTGFVIAMAAFALMGTIQAFVGGLIFGTGGGVVGCLVHLVQGEGLTIRDMRILHRPWRRRLTFTLFKVSLASIVSSVSLMSRRVIDRSYLLTIGDPAILGAYAIVARAAELVGFSFSLPAVGFAPLFIKGHTEPTTQRLARQAYTVYVFASFVAVAAAIVLAPLLPWPDTTSVLAEVTKLWTPVLAGTLFLGEITVAGFGYIIRRKVWIFATLSIGFPIVYIVVIIALAAAGFGTQALGWAFAASSFLFATAVIACSERLVRFGYRMIWLSGIRLATFAIALYAMEFAH